MKRTRTKCVTRSPASTAQQTFTVALTTNTQYTLSNPRMPTDTGLGETDQQNNDTTYDWIEDTTPHERIQSVIARSYHPQSTEEIADRSHVPPIKTEYILQQLHDDDRVKRITDPDPDPDNDTNDDETTWWARDPTAVTQTLTDLVCEVSDRIQETADNDDLDPETEIEMIADRSHVSPKRVREVFQFLTADTQDDVTEDVDDA